MGGASGNFSGSKRPDREHMNLDPCPYMRSASFIFLSGFISTGFLSAGSTIVRIGSLVDNSGINHVTQQRAVSQTLRWRLHHRQNKHLLFRIDPKGRSARATPIVFPWRAVERGNTGIAPHGKAEAKTVPWSGRIIWPRHYSTAEVIAGHIRDGFRPKYLLTM